VAHSARGVGKEPGTVRCDPVDPVQQNFIALMLRRTAFSRPLGPDQNARDLIDLWIPTSVRLPTSREQRARGCPRLNQDFTLAYGDELRAHRAVLHGARETTASEPLGDTPG